MTSPPINPTFGLAPIAPFKSFHDPDVVQLTLSLHHLRNESLNRDPAKVGAWPDAPRYDGLPGDAVSPLGSSSDNSGAIDRNPKVDAQNDTSDVCECYVSSNESEHTTGVGHSRDEAQENFSDHNPMYEGHHGEDCNSAMVLDEWDGNFTGYSSSCFDSETQDGQISPGMHGVPMMPQAALHAQSWRPICDPDCEVDLDLLKRFNDGAESAASQREDSLNAASTDKPPAPKREAEDNTPEKHQAIVVTHAYNLRDRPKVQERRTDGGEARNRARQTRSHTSKPRSLSTCSNGNPKKRKNFLGKNGAPQNRIPPRAAIGGRGCRSRSQKQHVVPTTLSARHGSRIFYEVRKLLKTEVETVGTRHLVRWADSWVRGRDFKKY